MEPIKIGSTIPAEKIHYLIEKFSFKKSLDIDFEDYRDRFVYSFSLNREAFSDIALYNGLANFVIDIMLNFYAEGFIRRRVNKLFKDLRGVDKSQVVEEAYQILLDKKQLKDEKDRLKNEVLDFLIEHNCLIIDGFIIFRPRSLNNLADKAIEKAMERLYLLLEYRDYIETLRLFIDTQYSQMEVVNLVVSDEGIQLLDPFNNKINNEEIKYILEEIFEEEISESDIILSSLLTLAPKNIIVHGNADNSDLLVLLKEIFKGRIHDCIGCEVCLIESIVVKNKS